MASSSTKWLIALAVALLFIIISMPWTYQLTNMLTASFAPTIKSGASVITPFGYILHALVIFLVVRLILVFY